MRRKSRNPERTREKILREATAEFAARSYDGARVDSIARRCRLSKNMLYHYFGSKEGLFIAVLEQMYEMFRKRQRDFAARGGDPVKAMRQLVAHTFQALWDNPEVIALLNSENLHHGRHIKRSRRVRNLYDPLVDTIREVLRRGVAEGVFRPNIDPVTLYVSFSSMAYHYISNQYTLRVILGVDFGTAERRRAWLNHISDMVLAYCAVDRGSEAAGQRSA
ncbi:MAG: TetR family transcriptional regulator [Alphaproteobacteria bacterium]|nr:TetR family transcriptional regulator [Alphaproteobacteria bacterium]